MSGLAFFSLHLASAGGRIDALLLANCKQKITKLGFDTVDGEPLKITVSPNSYGYLGTELEDYLRKK